MSIEGRVALVTGATRGIGKAIILRLASQGVTIIGTATTEAGAEQIKANLADVGNAGTGVVLDISSVDSISAMIAEINEQFKAPTILVNNAGITRDNLMLRMKENEWDEVINTNLSSVYRVSKAVLRGMTKAGWGRIISIGSVIARMGNAGQVNYAASKAGIEGFSRSLAREVGSRGITVNSVAPGLIDTDMTKNLSDDHKKILLKNVPVRRLGQPEEISSAVGFLASDEASYITGETLHVNGGMYM